jgi:NIPSNAP protein
MMVRAVVRWEIAYGHAKEVFAGLEALTAVCRDRGWAAPTAWAPFSGKENEIIVSYDYPDLAAYVAERDERFADAEFMQAWRECARHAAQGSIWNEVLEPVPDLG